MPDPIRIAILGTGQMGSGMLRLALEKPGLELAGVFARRPERRGLDAGLACGAGREIGLPIDTHLEAMLERTRPRVAIQATCSRLTDAAPELHVLIDRGVHCISIAEELAYPAATSPRKAAKLHQSALRRRVAVLGTGINPGFVLDLLVIVLTGVCARVSSINATRINDLSPYGPSVLRSQGVGLSAEGFAEGVKDGSVAGHFGFPQSIHMIGHALGWTIERIEETREPIVSEIRRETPFVTVAPGQVAGCLHTATAYRNGEPVIELVHPQQIHPELAGVETGDRIEIRGVPDIRVAGSPEIPGGQGTIALALNLVPRVLAATPGLHCMADLPVAAALPDRLPQGDTLR